MTDEELASMWFDARDEYEQSEPGTNVTRLRAFARRIAEAEREACAKVCDKEAGKWRGQQDVTDFRICAAAIRARGEK